MIALSWEILGLLFMAPTDDRKGYHTLVPTLLLIVKQVLYRNNKPISREDVVKEGVS